MLNSHFPLKDKRLSSFFLPSKISPWKEKQTLEKQYLVVQHNSLSWWALLQGHDYMNFSLQHVELEVEFSPAWLSQVLSRGWSKKMQIRKRECALRQAFNRPQQFSQKRTISNRKLGFDSVLQGKRGTTKTKHIDKTLKILSLKWGLLHGNTQIPNWLVKCKWFCCFWNSQIICLHLNKVKPYIWRA